MLPNRAEINSIVLQPRTFSESAVVAIIDSNQFTPEHWPSSARFGGSWCAEPPNYGLTMSQILRFPDSVSRRTPKDGTPQASIAGTEAKMSSLPVMTGDQWNEFIRLLTPEEQQAFMADVWKLINLYCRRIGGD